MIQAPSRRLQPKNMTKEYAEKGKMSKWMNLVVIAFRCGKSEIHIMMHPHLFGWDGFFVFFSVMPWEKIKKIHQSPNLGNSQVKKELKIQKINKWIEEGRLDQSSNDIIDYLSDPAVFIFYFRCSDFLIYIPRMQNVCIHQKTCLIVLPFVCLFTYVIVSETSAFLEDSQNADCHIQMH